MQAADVTATIIKLTVPSSDDQHQFVRTDRLDLITGALAATDWTLLADEPLAKVYGAPGFDGARPFVLISSHIDSVYGSFWARVVGDELHGTTDNSAGDGAVLRAMLDGRLPAQTLVSFTGDEEDESRGADQTVRVIREAGIAGNLAVVVVLDVTEEGPDRCFTIENPFAAHHTTVTPLRFENKRSIRGYLEPILGDFPWFEEAEADESWQYDEHRLNCFSLCLPCVLLGDDMHEDSGLAIRLGAVTGYLEALVRLVQGIAADLAAR